MREIWELMKGVVGRGVHGDSADQILLFVVMVGSVMGIKTLVERRKEIELDRRQVIQIVLFGSLLICFVVFLLATKNHPINNQSVVTKQDSVVNLRVDEPTKVIDSSTSTIENAAEEESLKAEDTSTNVQEK